MSTEKEPNPPSLGAVLTRGLGLSEVVGPKARDVLRTCAAHDAGAGCQL